MARQPFYGRGPGPAIARMDMQAATAPGRAYGQMYANLGKQAGDTIKQYGLNKEKRAKLIGEIEAYYDVNKDALGEIGMSGDEAQDKKDFTEREKFVKGDMSMAQLEGYAGKLARGDVLKTKNAQNEARAIANEMGRVNLDITNQLKDTRINIEKDKGVISKLARELAVEINPQKKELLTEQMTEAIANLGLGDQRRELQKATMASQTEVLPLQTDAKKAQLGAVPGQVKRQEELGDLQVKAANRADTSADLLLQAFGGAEGKAEFDYQGAKLSRKNLKLGMKVLSQKGDYYDYLATAKNVPVDTKKQYASIVSDIGKLTDTLVKDPDTGNQITFEKYMEFANDDADLYPLTGANSGPAGRLYGSFLTAQKQADDLLKTTQVQVDDGQGTGGSPAPTRSTMNVGNMPPEQAMQALRDRIGALRRLGPSINAQRQQPGQTMPMSSMPLGSSAGFTPQAYAQTTQAPQSIDYIENQSDAQTQQDKQRRLDLAAAEAQLLELQNQFGVR